MGYAAELPSGKETSGLIESAGGGRVLSKRLTVQWGF